MKAIKPEAVKVAKPKFIISGKAGVGKTIFSLHFPKAFVIDTEGGATRPEYVDIMKEVDAVYMGKDQGSQDFQTVIDQLKELATTNHVYETLIIDSFSKLYNLTAAIAEEKIGSDFGRDKREANKPTRQLMRWMEACDMNIILVCHQKDRWEGSGKERSVTGTFFDGYDKLEYDLDLWIEAQQIGRARHFLVKKSRIKNFIVGNSYPLDYDTFASLYGRDIIEDKSVPIQLAKPDQIQEIKRLIDVFNISPEDQEKSLKKYGVDDYEDLSQDQATKIIDSLTKRLKG